MKTAYRLASTVVDVETDEPGSGAWLSEFLHPWAEVVPHGSGGTVVRMVTSPASVDAIERRRVGTCARQVPCFALDSRVVVLPAWDDRGGMVIADAELACHYRLEPGAVEVVARPESRRARIGLMRVVREMLAAPVVGTGAIAEVHAAAFCVGERAVLLAGAKGTGKTTMLIHALMSRSASFVANDRVFIGGSSGPAFVGGVPTVVSIRPPTLRFFPILGIAAEGLRLSPAELARRLGVSRARGAPIAAVVFPLVSGAVDAWSFEPLSSADGAARLRANLYGAGPEGPERTVFAGASSGSAPPGAQEAVIDSLVARVPCIRVHAGRRAYRGGPGEWLGALGLDLESGVRER